MKQYRFIAVLLCLIILGHTFARAQDMDTEITKLTEDLAAKISNKQCKKVSVVDFTDFENNPTELGKYIADQMTVDFAMTNRDFSVLDRAHLKNIMDEHKLTSSGLVDPGNAKQLGLLAGVDALIFGKVTTIGDKISVTVEVIATDSGSVLTASKIKLSHDNSLKQFIPKLEAVAPTPHPRATTSDMPSQTNGNLAVVVTRLQTVTDHFNADWYQIDLSFQNTSGGDSIAVAMLAEQCPGEPCQLQSDLISGDGIEYAAYDNGLMGIHPLRQNPLNLTVINPGEQLRASLKFSKRQNPSLTNTKFSLRSTIVVNQNYIAGSYDNYQMKNNTLPPNCQTITFFMDLPASKIPQANYVPPNGSIPRNNYGPPPTYVPNKIYVPQNNRPLPKYYK